MNGKARMSGLVLEEMYASDMLDVLHFLFEEDNKFDTEQSFLAKSKLRSMIFEDMYGTQYKYAYVPPKKSGPAQPSYGSDIEDTESEWGSIDEDEALQPFNPREKQPPKPPAQAITEFDIDAENPFPGLDAPMR